MRSALNAIRSTLASRKLTELMVVLISSTPFFRTWKLYEKDMVFKMRYSGIGGQAVMEGVMMKNQEKYAVAVRKPDHEIEVKVSEYTGIIKNKKIRNMPVLRGVFSCREALVLGMQTWTYSAFF